MTTPAPAPLPAPREPFPIQAAKFSLYVPITLMILNCVISGGMNASHTSVPGAEQNAQRLVSIGLAILGGIGVTAGFILGIIALFGIPRHGTRHILWRAVTGICLNGLFVASAIFLFLFLPRLTSAPVDRSLTTSGYTVEGVPSPDRLWTATDYTTAISALSTISARDINALPRWKNPRSGELFDHIIEPANFTAAFPDDLPAKLQNEAKLAQAGKPLFDLYVNATQQGAKYPAELVELFGWELQLADSVDHDMDAFLARIPLRDPRHAEVAHQFDTGRAHFPVAIDGAVSLLNEKDLPPDCVVRLANHEELFLIPLLHTESPADITRLAAEVAATRDATPDPAAKSALDHLHTAILTPQKH